jgi:hypothetical protein
LAGEPLQGLDVLALLSFGLGLRGLLDGSAGPRRRLELLLQARLDLDEAVDDLAWKRHWVRRVDGVGANDLLDLGVGLVRTPEGDEARGVIGARALDGGRLAQGVRRRGVQDFAKAIDALRVASRIVRRLGPFELARVIRARRRRGEKHRERDEKNGDPM